MIIESNKPILNSLKLNSIAKESVVVSNTDDLHEVSTTHTIIIILNI